MLRARPNPIGLVVQPLLHLVRLGSGEHTHVLNPNTGRTLCESGRGRAKATQPLFRSNARSITCYRCAKLARLNMEAGRQPWEAP